MGPNTPVHFEPPRREIESEREVLRRMLREVAEGRAQQPDFALRALHAARFREIGERSSTVAHELRQPLFTIAVASENLRLLLERPDLDIERLKRATDRIAEQVARAHAIIDQTLAKESFPPAPEQSDAAAAANASVGYLEEFFAEQGLRVEYRRPLANASVNVSRVWMEQVFVNLMRNAADSIAERRRCGWQGPGEIRVAVEVHGDLVRCAVTDNGAGLSEDTRPNDLFDPFVTTKAEGGTGLGLHICREIIAAAGGVICLIPGAIEGVTVEIGLPHAGAA